MNRVHIEFQRVQSWLFAVPRLRAMVGANTRLGEVLRLELPELARANRNWKLAPCDDAESYPTADEHDPLAAHDDPSADARHGILARDGGHFEAQFCKGAKEFADAAAELIRRELPGLRFRIWIDGMERQEAPTSISTELPVLAPCEWTGRGVASAVIQQGTERAAVSMEVARRHEAARRAEGGLAQDLASLLAKTTKLASLRRAQDLEDLVGSGYLALVQADGNGVGSAAGNKSDVERARFYHRNRVLIRRALKDAIDTLVSRGRLPAAPGQSAPLLLLMLGGDDLLVICRAETALPFVVSLCEQLAALQHGNTNGFELTLGVGVVIAKHKIPIHRLHEVAESLVASAKRRFRGMRHACMPPRSVVDWAVYTTSWVDDPEEIRRRDWIRGAGSDRRILSQRPVDVLGDGLQSLQGLLDGAYKLQNQNAPRSQLRYLVDQLGRGRVLAELAFKELSPSARRALASAGVKEPWRQVADNGVWVTELLDLIEIAEIGRLGRSAEATRSAAEVAHG